MLLDEPARTGSFAGARLRRKLDLLARPWTLGPDVAAVYPEWLYRMWATARASVPLMQCAVERARELGDPTCARMVPYLLEHIAEEADHAQWALDDLEVLGQSRASVLARNTPADLAAAVGAQYYWIRHDHPVALFGYMAVLEGTMPSVDTVRELATSSGLPAQAFRTLEEHARLDGEHQQELFALIDRLPLDARLEALLGVSLLHTLGAVQGPLPKS